MVSDLMNDVAQPGPGPATRLRLAVVLPTANRASYWIPLLKQLMARTSHTVVFTTNPGGALTPGTDKTTGLDIRVVGPSRWIGRAGGDDYDTGMRLLSPSLAFRLWRFRPDVVVTAAFSMWSVLIALGRRIGLWRMVVLYDGSSPAVDHRDSRLRTWLRRWMVKTADASISNSTAGRNYLADYLNGGDTAKVMPFLVSDVEALGGGRAPIPPGSERVLLAVGVLEKRKGIHLLLNALASSHASTMPDWTLILVGDGPERQTLEAQAKALQIADRVQFAGWVDHGQLGGFFRQADVFVFPTLADTWGVVLLEAMAFGKPVVASNLAGSSELVDEGVTGHVVSPYDEAAFVQAVTAVIADRDVARRMGASSLRQIAAHTPTAAADRMLSLFCSITLSDVNPSSGQVAD